MPSESSVKYTGYILERMYVNLPVNSCYHQSPTVTNELSILNDTPSTTRSLNCAS